MQLLIDECREASKNPHPGRPKCGTCHLPSAASCPDSGGFWIRAHCPINCPLSNVRRKLRSSCSASQLGWFEPEPVSCQTFISQLISGDLKTKRNKLDLKRSGPLGSLALFQKSLGPTSCQHLTISEFLGPAGHVIAKSLDPAFLVTPRQCQGG